MAARRPMTIAQIAANVAGYDGADVDDDAFRRKFERDKETLRELGIPLVLSFTDPLFEDEQGYLIPRRDYALPDIDLDPDEAAPLGLAAGLWASASLAG